MYYIRYVDPMTGLSFDYKSESLDEVVRAVSRAKNDLYYKGYASTEPLEDATANQDASPKPEQEAETVYSSEEGAKESVSSIPEDDEDYDDNMYGHWF